MLLGATSCRVCSHWGAQVIDRIYIFQKQLTQNEKTPIFCQATCLGKLPMKHSSNVQHPRYGHLRPNPLILDTKYSTALGETSLLSISIEHFPQIIH